MSDRKVGRGTETTVLTVRIDKDLDTILEDIKKKRGITKANVIRNYLEMAKYMIVEHGSIKSTDDRDLIIIKRSNFRKFLEIMDEELQIGWGIKIARFINDLARWGGQLENLEYKLEICENLGFFNKSIDKENYILFAKKFGSEKFVEAFVIKLIKHDNVKDEYIISFSTDSLESSKSLRNKYIKEIGPVIRNKSYYSFEFAKLEKE